MIVISPTTESLKYFTGLVKDAWTNYMLRDSEVLDSLEKEEKTLVISCNLTEGEVIIPVKFHYRFLKGDLYCFVEEV